MRIKFMLFIFMAFFAFGYAQTPAVAGVSLASTYENVERTLEQRYGTTIGKEHNKITYYDIEIGGFTYHYATFYFINKLGERRLNSVELSRHFDLDELNRAKNFRDNIADTYRKKYPDIESGKNEDGYKIYRCFYDKKKEFYNILIFFEKGKSNGGDTYYYVTVSYGPWWIENNLDDI